MSNLTDLYVNSRTAIVSCGGGRQELLRLILEARECEIGVLYSEEYFGVWERPEPLELIVPDYMMYGEDSTPCEREYSHNLNDHSTTSVSESYILKTMPRASASKVKSRSPPSVSVKVNYTQSVYKAMSER